MRRREFITLFGGAALAAPHTAHAQERMRRIGVLMGFAENDPEGQGFARGISRRDFRRSAGRRATTSASKPAGRRPAGTRRRGSDSQGARRAAARSDPVGHTLPRHPHCYNRHAPSRSCSQPLPIRSAAISSRAFPARAATSPVSLRWSRRWRANGWSFSRRLRLALSGLPSCSTRQRRRTSSII